MEYFKPNTTFHSSFKPYLSSTFANATDSVVPFKFYAFKNLFLSKTLNENSKKQNRYNVQVLPILDAEIGYDGLLKEPSHESTIGGAHVKFNINNDFTFALSVYGGKNTMPFSSDTSISKQKILPAYGQGYGNSKTVTLSLITPDIFPTPQTIIKFLYFQLGRDKHFIGDGISRSLLLSDYGPATP